MEWGSRHWELEATPFSVDHTIESVARRLPQRISVQAYLTQRAEAMERWTLPFA